MLRNDLKAEAVARDLCVDVLWTCRMLLSERTTFNRPFKMENPSYTISYT